MLFQGPAVSFRERIFFSVKFWDTLAFCTGGGFLQVPAAREVGLLHLCEFIEASLVGWSPGLVNRGP